MGRLRLTIAMDEIDAVRPLVDGSVRPDGIDLNVLTVTDATRHVRMWHHREFDGAEYSIGSHLLGRSRGLEDLVGIPVFPRRMFPHRFFFVRADAGIRGPCDLAARRVGIHSYENSLALVARGMLQHDHGVPPADIRWVTAREGLLGMEAPAGVHIERAPAGRTLPELLEAGEIDAMVYPEIIEAFQRGAPTVRRLFPEVKQTEMAFHRAHRIFPIMHIVVLKREVLVRDPWVAVSLRNAFEEGKRLAYAFYEQPYRSSLAWLGPLWEEERAVLGPDPFPHTVRDNVHDLEVLMRWAVEQGIVSRPLPMEALFAPSTLRL